MFSAAAMEPSPSPSPFPFALAENEAIAGNKTRAYPFAATFISSLLADCPIDLVLVLDSSCSISADGWKQAVASLSQLVSNLSISPSNTHLGIVEFAKKVSDRLYPSGDVSAVQAALAQLPHQGPHTMGCETHTGGGLEHAQEMLDLYGRPNLPHIALIITDGAPLPNRQIPAARKAADAMKLKGTRIIAAGVDIRSAKDEDEIKYYVSSPGDYFPVSDWDKLEADLASIVQSACQSLYICEGSSCVPSKDPSAVSKDECEKSCKPAPAPPAPPTDCKTDLILVLDSSCSISKKGWKDGVAAVGLLASNLTISPSNTHLGIVEFAKKVADRLNPSADVSAVQAALAQLPHQGPHTMGCETHTDEGMQHAQAMLDTYGRPNASHVALIITDGAPLPNRAIPAARKAADAMKLKGTRIIAAGVDIRSTKDEDEIKYYVSFPGDYFPVSDWDKLEADLGSIVMKSCRGDFECIDDTCRPSNSSAAVSKTECESSCPARYECEGDVSPMCVLTNSSSGTSKYTCENSCGKAPP
jgi:Mg-chelatase subunit ChlD